MLGPRTEDRCRRVAIPLLLASLRVPRQVATWSLSTTTQHDRRVGWSGCLTWCVSCWVVSQYVGGGGSERGGGRRTWLGAAGMTTLYASKHFRFVSLRLRVSPSTSTSIKRHTNHHSTTRRLYPAIAYHLTSNGIETEKIIASLPLPITIITIIIKSSSPLLLSRLQASRQCTPPQANLVLANIRRLTRTSQQPNPQKTSRQQTRGRADSWCVLLAGWEP